MPTLEAVKAKLSGLLNSQDHTAEVNLAGYAFGVIAAAAILLYWTHLGPRDASLALAFGAFCTAITTGLWKKGSAVATPTPTTQGAPREEGEKP